MHTVAHESNSNTMMGEGQTSRDDLILRHLPQVHHIAQAILARLPAHAEIDDLLGAGALGLLDAVEKFDPSRSVKFRTYAELRIRGAILDSLRGPADTELAEAMNVTLEQFYELSSRIHGMTAPGSLQEAVSPDDDSVGEIRDDFAATPPEMDPFFQCHKAEVNQLVQDAIDRLPRRERLVVALYYYDEMTVKEIGKVLGVKESGVSQIRTKALHRLRMRLKRVVNDGCRKASAVAH
ncbi:MAG: FliA/WhiG family RNA polymerase sigma factor [Acidobacteria bacterium]|nr:MAG: FliA/WhiG family RNA polymerase sigma factor [Acidobacteriota bacterium]